MTHLRVGELWRYPVKSLHGETVDAVEIGPGGVVGDRVLHVRDDRGLVTGRSRHTLLTLRATTDDAGDVLVDGHPWASPAAADRVRTAAGADARLVRHTGPERFDVLPVLVATTAEVDRLGVDRRRLRPNLVVSGAAPGEERGWPGHALRIGTDVVLGVDSVRLRCIVTTVDPDTADRTPDVLRRIHRDFAGRIALNCWVIAGGAVRHDDEVSVVPMPADAMDSHPGYASWISGEIPYPTSVG